MTNTGRRLTPRRLRDAILTLEIALADEQRKIEEIEQELTALQDEHICALDRMDKLRRELEATP